MSKTLSTPFKVLNIVLACIQNMTLGGIIYGWASISGSLLISDAENGGPGLSAEYIHMMFVVATFFNFLGPLILGIVLDHYGPRVCSLISIFFVSSGCFLFSISDKDKFPFFVPAISMIAFGGPGAQSAIIHLSNLFPTWKATATAFITGSFQLSFIVFLVFDQLWLFKKMSYSTLFLGYSVICALNAVVSIFLWPNEPYSFDEQVKILEDEHQIDHEQAENPHLGPIRLPSVFMHHKTYQKLKRSDSSQARFALASSTGTVSLKESSLQNQLLSPEFLYLSYFFLINAFWVNFYIGTFDLQLADLHVLEDGEAQNYARLFTLIITLGVVGIPLIGAIMDTFGYPVTSMVTVGAGIAWSLLLQIPHSAALIASFICYAIYRTFFYTFFFAYLADVLGFKYFGVLAGVVFVVGGVMSFLQYPLAEYGSGSCTAYSATPSTDCACNWPKISAFATFLIISTLIFSYQDFRRRTEAKKWQQAIYNVDPTNHPAVFVNSSGNVRSVLQNRDVIQEMMPFNISQTQQQERPLRSVLKSGSANASNSTSGGFNFTQGRESYGAV